MSYLLLLLLKQLIYNALSTIQNQILGRCTYVISRLRLRQTVKFSEMGSDLQVLESECPTREGPLPMVVPYPRFHQLRLICGMCVSVGDVPGKLLSAVDRSSVLYVKRSIFTVYGKQWEASRAPSRGR